MHVTLMAVKMPIFNLVSHHKNCLTKVGSQRHEITVVELQVLSIIRLINYPNSNMSLLKEPISSWLGIKSSF